MSQQENYLLVFESLPVTAHLHSSESIKFLRLPFDNVINVLENYFAHPIMKVIGKRKPFKTNNSSEVVWLALF